MIDQLSIYIGYAIALGFLFGVLFSFADFTPRIIQPLLISWRNRFIGYFWPSVKSHDPFASDRAEATATLPESVASHMIIRKPVVGLIIVCLLLTVSTLAQ